MKHSMHELISQFIDFLRSHGINVDIVIVLLAVPLFIWAVRDIREWPHLVYYKKWLVVSNIAAATLMLLAGLLLLLID